MVTRQQYVKLAIIFLSVALTIFMVWLASLLLHKAEQPKSLEAVNNLLPFEPSPTPTPTPTPVPASSLLSKPSGHKPTKSNAVKRKGSLTASLPPALPYPTPTRPGLLGRAYSGDVIGDGYPVPVGTVITLQPSPPSTQKSYRCIFNIPGGKAVNMPCSYDWTQTNGSIMRGHFSPCFKEVTNQGKPGEPTKAIFDKYFVKEDNCSWQRLHDQ